MADEVEVTPFNMDSILICVKKVLGIDAEYTHFDPDIILSINSVLMTVGQLGIGAEAGVFITDDTAEWTDLIGTATNLEAIKMYIYMKVRLLFDPPTSSFVVDALERQIKESEWRLMVQVDPPYVEEVVEEDA